MCLLFYIRVIIQKQYCNWCLDWFWFLMMKKLNCPKYIVYKSKSKLNNKIQHLSLLKDLCCKSPCFFCTLQNLHTHTRLLWLSTKTLFSVDRTWETNSSFLCWSSVVIDLSITSWIPTSPLCHCVTASSYLLPPLLVYRYYGNWLTCCCWHVSLCVWHVSLCVSCNKKRVPKHIISTAHQWSWAPPDLPPTRLNSTTINCYVSSHLLKHTFHWTAPVTRLYLWGLGLYQTLHLLTIIFKRYL